MSYIKLTADGYFQQNGKRLVPVGVNYWPGSCGVELWRSWPTGEIRRDLDTVKKLGLNTVRFFLRWQDFEPEPGNFDERMWDRLRQMLGWCLETKLLAHPSLFVGWMSGGVFWPQWKARKNLYSDPLMRVRAREFASRACQQMIEFAENLLAVDLGNELNCLDDCRSASPTDVRSWCADICATVRERLPQTLIVSGNDQNQVTADTGWRFGEQPGTDFLSVHGYPVPAWHPVAFDGMTDPFTATLLPLYTKCARAFAPVMVQEFGTIITFGRTQQDQYLRRMLPALWEAGANGFLWWCMKDITSTDHPYEKCGFESNLGLVDSSGNPKPGLEYFFEFARQLPDLAIPEHPDGIALLWPSQYYPKENPLNVGNDPSTVSRRMLMANHLMESLGMQATVVREDGEWNRDLRTIVVAGVNVGHAGATRLLDFVKCGGNIILHGINPTILGPAMIDLLGAQPVDLRTATKLFVEFAGKSWTFVPGAKDMWPELSPTTAEVLARDQAGRATVFLNRVGKGAVLWVIPCVEDAALAAESTIHRDQWMNWYAAEWEALGPRAQTARIIS